MAIKALQSSTRPSIECLQTSFPHFNQVMASGSRGQCGVPKGFVSVFTGEAGTGKTRFLTQVAANLSSSGSVLYCQGEMRLDLFESQYLVHLENGVVRNNFNLSTEFNLCEIDKDLRTTKPDFVVIDSINIFQEYATRQGCMHICGLLSSWASKHNCHIAVIAQRTKDGKIKGPSEIMHDPDIIFDLQHAYHPGKGKRKIPNTFKLIIPNKNRAGGKVGIPIYYVHTDEGIVELGFEDKFWKLYVAGGKQRIRELEAQQAKSAQPVAKPTKKRGFIAWLDSLLDEMK